MAAEHVLVSGGAGFIGTSVAAGFVAAGFQVTSVDQSECAEPGVRSIIGDLRDHSVRDHALGTDVTGVVHLAAATSVVGSLDDPLGIFQDNVAVTAAMLELARSRGVRRFLMSSTNAVVGEVGDTTIDEDVPPRPLTPYGATKAAGEMLLSAYAGSYGMSTCALRLTNVYGPGMSHKDSFVARLMRAARSDSGVEVYGDGLQQRDFVFVRDVVAAFLLAWRTGAVGTLIIGSGQSVTMLDLIQRVRNVTGRKIPVDHQPPRSGEMSAVIVDIDRARSVGFEPSVSLDDGLAEVWVEAAHGWEPPAG